MITDLQAQINSYLQDHIQSECDEPTLATSTAYSLLAGGKRLRPALT